MNNTWNANPTVYDLSSKKNAIIAAGDKSQEAGWLLTDAIVDEGVDDLEPITEEEVYGMLHGEEF
jgi:hypothetical protein